MYVVLGEINTILLNKPLIFEFPERVCTNNGFKKGFPAIGMMR